MFHGPSVLLCITHAYNIFIVAIDTVEGGANELRNKI